MLTLDKFEEAEKIVKNRKKKQVLDLDYMVLREKV